MTGEVRRSAIWATVSLAGMLTGAIGVSAAPQEYFGIFERASLFAATGFNAVLGIYLFTGRIDQKLLIP